MAIADLGTKVISTGNKEIDKKLGGGIPLGSLVLMEGQSDAGKSVVCQHFTYGALISNLNTAYYIELFCRSSCPNSNEATIFNCEFGISGG